jgi:hypothetical protein
VKHLEKDFQRLSLWIILLIFSGITPINAQSGAVPVDADNSTFESIDNLMDSIEVSLLTCSPHEEIYSLYGHSAIRWHNLRQQGPGAVTEDFVFNWGVFDFRKPYFIPRFVFGLTDYELGAYPYNYFWPYYKEYGSSVVEQVINLTNAEKIRLKEILVENLRPENKVYRYNYFYDNCSTRPRDIIEKCISGKVEYAQREEYTPSYREMVHQCTRNHPWAAFGNDILLGVRADMKTSLREQEFLPGNLMYDFDRAQIYVDGQYRPLVKERRILVPPGVQIIEQDFPLTPTECAWILMAICLIIVVWEWRRGKTLKYWDALLMLLQGLAGCVLFVMLFSQHPTTSTNLQILLLNPVSLFFIPSILRRRPTHWWRILTVMTVLFLLGGIFQQYAEGMIIVALSLLSRAMIHLKVKV